MKAIASVMTGLLLCPAFPAQGRGQAYDARAEVAEDRLLPVFAVELRHADSKDNAWSRTRAAFRAVRRAQAEPEGAEAVAALMGVYNERLAPSLRGLRHSVFFTHKLFQSLNLSLTAVGVNARKGRASEPRTSGEQVDLGGPPRPVARKDLDENRLLAREPAAAARASLEEALRALEKEGESGKAGEAREAMREAVEAALAVARRLEALHADDGPLHRALLAGEGYLEAANRELKPVAAERRTAARTHNAAAREFASIEFALAADGAQARYLHGEIDKLGKL